MADAVPEVLFVCVHNAGRSQMAAALLHHHHHAAGAVRVTSAGSAPADQINPAVREVMAEIGIDLSHEFPKKLTTDSVAAADVVITMGHRGRRPPRGAATPGMRAVDDHCERQWSGEVSVLRAARLATVLNIRAVVRPPAEGERGARPVAAANRA
jgi:protein-tyrosine-phosphatase